VRLSLWKRVCIKKMLVIVRLRLIPIGIKE
jgi:hypothetical protein